MESNALKKSSDDFVAAAFLFLSISAIIWRLVRIWDEDSVFGFFFFFFFFFFLSKTVLIFNKNFLNFESHVKINFSLYLTFKIQLLSL